MTDREQSGLRGPVRTCRTERDYVRSDRPWAMQTDETFALDGRMLERRHRNPGGSQWSHVFRYDAQGRTIEKEATDTDNTLLVFTYHYDGLGRLERVVLHSTGDGDRVFVSMQYADDGTKTKTEYPTPLREKNVSVSAESMLHSSIDTAAIMTILDANHRPTRKVLYDADDRVIRRIAFRYDANGLLLEEGELIGGCIRDDFRNVYRYDASGRKIEVSQTWGDLGGSRRTYVYNDHGDVAEEVVEQNSGVLSEDRDPQLWTQRYNFQYDEHGNWTERAMETIPSSSETLLDVIERRGLIYS